MAEAYGLDTRIEKYKGTRPIGLWSRDLGSQEYQTLKDLKAKIYALLDQAHPNRGQ
jgi:hypothetical protein